MKYFSDNYNNILCHSAPQNTSTSAINLVSMCIVIVSEVMSKNDQNNTNHTTIRTILNEKPIPASVLLKIYPPLFLLEVTAHPTKPLRPRDPPRLRYTTYTARRYANSATKTNGMTESNISDGAYQQTEQNVYSASIVAASILMIVFMI